MTVRARTLRWLLLAAAWLAAALPVSAASINLTTSGSSGTLNGAWFFQGTEKSGTGGWAPFLRVQATGTEAGYNASGAQVMPAVKTGSWTHDILLGHWPVVIYNGVSYYSLGLDVNQNSGASLLSLDKLEVWLAGAPLANASTHDLLAAGATKVFDLDTGDPNNEVLLNAALSSGSGSADMSVLLPVSQIGANGALSVYLYCEFGNKGGSYQSNGGFEEWADKALASGQLQQSYNTSVGDQVWYDNNLDGVKQSAETGLSGVRVYVDYNNNGTYDLLSDPSAVTDANGRYTITNIVPGSWSLRVDASSLPSGLVSVWDLDGTNTPNYATFSINTNQTRSDLDFGYVVGRSLGNQVFRDNGAGGGAANDGVRNGSEGGIANVVMKLYGADGSGNPAGSLLGTQTTDANGYYRFDNLLPSAYVVVVDVAGSGSALSGLTNSTGVVTDTTLTGDLKDHGQDVPLATGSVLPGGIASAAVSLAATLPSSEATGSGQGAHGPTGDSYDNLVLDFGFTPTFSLGNRVFRDDGSSGGTPNDGIQNGAEPGIAGLVVKLYAADGAGGPTGAALATQSTDASGYYRFDGLTAGKYVPVVDVNSSGSVLTGLASSSGASTDTSATGDLKDHGKDAPLGAGSVLPGGGVGAAITLGVGLEPTGEAGTPGPNGDASDNLTDDFGFTPTYSLGNRVFYDLNNNGSRDFGENGVSGARLALFTNNAGSPAGSALQTTNTDANGDYRFDGLLPGAYVVVVDQANSSGLAHYVSSTGCSTDLALSGDMRDHGQDTPVSVGTVVNGIASGAVTLGLGLQPTNEVVANQPGAGQHGPSGDSCDNLTLDFGFTPAGSLGNRVFSDANNNGALDGGDSGLSGVHMVLFTADGSGHPTGSALATTNTDGSGYYRFDDLAPGAYVVVVDKANSSSLNGYASSTGTSTDTSLSGDSKDHGQDTLVTVGGVVNGIASAAVTVGPSLQPTAEATSSGAGANGPNGDAEDNLVVDFGLTLTAYSLGNRVYQDNGAGTNANNRLLDSDESGLPNVIVRLFAADGSGNPTGSVLASATTDASGYYRFDSLVAGSYVPVVDAAASGSALSGFVSSSGASTDTSLTGDRYDHGQDTLVTVGGVVNGIAGAAVTLGVGLQPTGEATGTGAGANGPSGDGSDNLTDDFGFVPTFSLGNRVFADNGASGGTAGNGIQDGAEPGIAHVAVQLKTNGLTVVAATTTDSSGYYRFDHVPAGTYTVFLPATNFAVSGPLASLLSSTSTKTGDQGDKGVDNANPAFNGIGTASLTVGPGLQPTSESDLGSGAGAHGLNGDSYDDLTVDFGMVSETGSCSLGSLVWHDANNNGQWDPGESGVNGVTVEVWSSDSAGNLITKLASPTTASDGTYDGVYIVTGLSPGLYRVRIPAAMFDSGQPLETWNASSTLRSSRDDHVDNDNNGQQTAPGQEVLSPLVALSPGNEPVDGSGVPDEFGPGATSDNGSTDANGNMTVDFGFYSSSSDQAHLCSLGSLVWKDANNNGVWDTGEPGLAAVTLELYQTNASGLTYWNSTTSASDGAYFFHDLPSGSNWVVHLPVSNFSSGHALELYPVSGGAPVDLDNQTDNDNNGRQTGGRGAEVWSPVINLTAGAEPTTAETGPGYAQDDPSSYGDANGDMTVDFGFTTTYSIGNRVFYDNGDGGGTANNGLQDGSEPGLANVLVQLKTNGLTVVATAATDANGYYRFDNVLAGAYSVFLPAANFAVSAPLAGLLSSTGTQPGDKGDKGVDNSDPSVNGMATASLSVGAGLQPTGESDLGSGAGAQGPNGDASDNLTIDLGFTPTYSIGNRVYRDPDNDGQPDLDYLDEGGISGVVMKLYAGDADGNATGSVLGATTTDSDGFYRFDGLAPGKYVVVVDLVNSPILSGSISAVGVSADTSASGDIYDHGKDGPLAEESVLPGGIASTPVTVGPGLQPLGESTATGAGANGPNGDAGDNLTLDFGFTPLFSLGNRVFLDTDNNGLMNGGDYGLSGVHLVLYTNNADSPGGSALATTNSDANGYYRFDGLRPGRYVVVVDVTGSGSVLSGLASSSGASLDTGLTGDVRDHGQDAPLGVGSVLPGGIASVPIILGRFNVPPLTGEAIGAAAGANGPNGDDADNLVLDFGFTPTYSLGNRVFNDSGAGTAGAANDGIQNGDEPGLADVVVKLFAASGASPTGTALAATTTDASGYYRFDGLVAASYVVVVDVAGSANLTGLLSSAGASANTSLAGDLLDHGLDTLVSLDTVVNGVASTPVTLGAGLQPASEATGAGAGANGPNGDGSDNLVLDFGFVAPVTIGNLVFKDLNNDGQFDPGSESGINGVSVELWNVGADGLPGGGDDTLVASTNTATVGAVDGAFSFRAYPGTYYLKIPAPPSYAPASSAVTGSDDNWNHGSQPGGSGSAAVTAAFTLAPGQANDTRDLGFYGPPPSITCPVLPAAVACASDVPAYATDLAGFLAQGGSAAGACGDVTVVWVSDLLIGPTLTRTYRATDLTCGTSADCHQTVTISDSIAPTFSAFPDEVSYGIADLGKTHPSYTGAPAATDNCGGTPTLTYTDALLADCTHQSLTRTWTATDTVGNQASRNQTITFSGAPSDIVPAVSVISSEEIHLAFTNLYGNLNKVQATKLVNCAMTGMAYDGTGTPTNLGSMALGVDLSLDTNITAVVLTATKVSGAYAVVNAQVWSDCGTSKSFDPVATALTVKNRGAVRQTFFQVMAAEHFARLENGAPGLSALHLIVNGHEFTLRPLQDGQVAVVNLAAAMNEGWENTVTLVGEGPVGARATVLITDNPALRLEEVLQAPAGSDPAHWLEWAQHVAVEDDSAQTGWVTSEYAANAPITLSNTVLAAPYPAGMRVAGVRGAAGPVTVSLVGLSHQYPSDLRALVVGPDGRSVLLMSGAGGPEPIEGVTLEFDDAASETLPLVGPLVTGRYKPTRLDAEPFLDPPAPAGPFGAALSVFQGINPNGEWRLYLENEPGCDDGVVAGGWRLKITVLEPRLSIAQEGERVVLSWPGDLAGFMVQGRTGLGAGAAWTPLSGTPDVVNGRYHLTLEASGAMKLFRLYRP